MIPVLLLGGSGQVGAALGRRLGGAYEVTALSAEDLDLADVAATREVVRQAAPQLILNAAAYTAVDQAEESAAKAMAVNGIAPGVLAEEAARLGAGVVHFSTDYVFDGEAATPYTEDSRPNPLNVYGATKLAGDQAVLASETPVWIFRTSWVYGLEGRNFLRTMLRLLRERETLQVVGDQVGAPTWCEAIAEATVEILAQGGVDPVGFMAARRGLYNMTCGGETTWYGFAEAIRAHLAEQAGDSLATLEETATAEYPTPAARPLYSVLDNARLRETFGVELPDWRSALARCLAEQPLAASAGGE